MHRNSSVSYNLELFDTAGQEEWEQLRRMMYANTDVFLVCYSCMQPSSFANVEKKWIDDVRTHDPSSLVILVALCIDLRTTNNPNSSNELITPTMITTQQGAELARRLNCQAFIECSSMLRFHVREVFECAIDVFERDCEQYSEDYFDKNQQCHRWLCCLMCCPSTKYRQKKKKKEKSVVKSDQYSSK